MRIIPKLLAPIVLILAVGCVSARIESNIRPGYSRSLDRLFVVYLSSDNDTVRFFEDLAPSLASSLYGLHVVNAKHVYTPLGLDEKKAVRAKIEEFKPNHILYVNLVSKTTTQFQRGFMYSPAAPSGARFELSLSEFGSEDTVWKATLDTQGSGFSAGFYAKGSVGSVAPTVEKIIECLQKDGLVKRNGLVPEKA